MPPESVLNALSVDVEDYFQVRSFSSRVTYSSWGSYESRLVRNTARLLDVFEKHGVKGTFFVLGWNAEREKKLVRDIHGAGHEVASHGWSHRCIYDMSREEFRSEAARTKALLEDLTGSRVVGYRAPSYSVIAKTQWALEVLAELGHLYDSSIYPVRRKAYGMPDERATPHVRQAGGRAIAEFPMSAVRIGPVSLPFGSGGYFRLAPLGVTLLLTRMFNRRGVPFIINVHPWEIDPSQPRVGPVLLHANHYLFLSRTEPRLERVLARHRFAPVREVLGGLGLLECTR